MYKMPDPKRDGGQFVDTHHRLAFRRLNCLLECLDFPPGPACGAETISTAGCRSLFINNRWYPFRLVRVLEHSLELGLELERSIRDRCNNDANYCGGTLKSASRPRTDFSCVEGWSARLPQLSGVPNLISPVFYTDLQLSQQQKALTARPSLAYVQGSADHSRVCRFTRRIHIRSIGIPPCGGLTRCHDRIYTITITSGPPQFLRLLYQLLEPCLGGAVASLVMHAERTSAWAATPRGWRRGAYSRRAAQYTRTLLSQPCEQSA
jgi:hypothetical protein